MEIGKGLEDIGVGLFTAEYWVKVARETYSAMRMLDMDFKTTTINLFCMYLLIFSCGHSSRIIIISYDAKKGLQYLCPLLEKL